MIDGHTLQIQNKPCNKNQLTGQLPEMGTGDGCFCLYLALEILGKVNSFCSGDIIFTCGEIGSESFVVGSDASESCLVSDGDGSGVGHEHNGIPEEVAPVHHGASFCLISWKSRTEKE